MRFQAPEFLKSLVWQSIPAKSVILAVHPCTQQRFLGNKKRRSPERPKYSNTYNLQLITYYFLDLTFWLCIL